MTELEAVSGCGPSKAKKLREAFITTAEILAVQNPAELQETTSLGEGTCLSLVRAARDLLSMDIFKTGLEVEKELESKPILSSGIEKIDSQMFGGIEIGNLVEFFGKATSGKTQWCYHYAVRSMLSLEEGGLEGRVMWLDTENSFKPRTLRANMKRWGLDPEVALMNISRARIHDSTQLEDVFLKVPMLAVEQNVKVVVIDSILGMFRADFTGLKNLAPRQQTINRLISKMRRLATAHEITFLYTNQAISKTGFFSVPNAPAGGHIIAHGNDYRFETKTTASKNKRKLHLKDNAGVPDFEQEVSFGWGGFYNDERERGPIEKDLVEYLESLGFSTDPDAPEEVAAEA
jgi:DNA repair protein RadA